MRIMCEIYLNNMARLKKLSLPVICLQPRERILDLSPLTLMMQQLFVSNALIMKSWGKEIRRSGFCLESYLNMSFLCVPAYNCIFQVKVRARLSRPLQRGRGRYGARDLRPRRGLMRGPPAPWGRPVSRRPPLRGSRVSTRVPPLADRSFKRPVTMRDRRPFMAVAPRGRPVAPLSRRSYDRRSPGMGSVLSFCFYLLFPLYSLFGDD